MPSRPDASAHYDKRHKERLTVRQIRLAGVLYMLRGAASLAVVALTLLGLFPPPI